MKQTIRALIVTMLFLCSITNLYSQRNLYWRPNATDLNFNNIGSWTDSPTGYGGTSPASPPTLLDNVYFNQAPVGTGQITCVGSANMANLTVGAPGYSFVSNVVYNIAGSIDADDSFSITRNTINLVNSTNPQNVTIKIGNSAKMLGEIISITKPGYTVTLLSDLNLPDTRIDKMDASFNSSGNDITVLRILTGAATAARVYDFSNSTVSTVSGVPSESGVGQNLFEAINTTYNFTNSHFIFKNEKTTFYGRATDNNETNAFVYNFNDITLENPKANYLHEYQQKAVFQFNNLNINTPLVKIMHNPSGYGSRLFSVNVDNLNLQQQATISFVDERVPTQTPTPINFNVNNIVESVTDCGKYSLLDGRCGIVLKATGAPLTTSHLMYRNVEFSSAGAMWTAPDYCNLMENSGQVTWTTSGLTGKNFYWRGGTGDWYDPANWQVGGSPANCVPSILDDVYVDAASFSADGQEIILSRSGFCNNIYWTDPNHRGSLMIKSTYDLYPNTTDAATRNDYYLSLTVAGSADFSGVKESGVWPDLYFIGSGTIKSASGSTYSSTAIYIRAAGTYTLENDFITRANCNIGTYTGASGSYFYHHNGGFNTNGKKLDVGPFTSVSVPVGSTRNLNVSNSEIYVTFHSHGLTRYTIYFDYDGGNLTYNFTNSHFFLKGLNIAGSLPAMYIRDSRSGSNHYWKFDKVTFPDEYGTAMLIFDQNFDEFKEITIKSDLQVGASSGNGTGFIVDVLNLYPNKTYKFTPKTQLGGLWFREVRIREALNVISDSGGCDMVTLTNNVTNQEGSNPALLTTDFSPFVINGAKVSYIEVKDAGNPLIVNGGIDNGHNVNVQITAFPPKDFYWVPKGGSGSGLWSDGGHWSIGVSGGNPTVTNASGCTPTDNDNVYFDENSFVSQNETVTMDVTPVFIKSMYWTEGVNSKKPVLKNNGTAITLNLYGSLELASQMTISGTLGSLNFRGTETDENAQFLNTNGVTGFSGIYFSGGGRYDLLSDVRTGGAFDISNGSSFYSHDHYINATHQFSTSGVNGTIDLGNSYIVTNWMRPTVGNCATYHAENATIQGAVVEITNNCGDDLYFRSIRYSSRITATDNNTYKIHTESAVSISGTTRIDATLVTDTLIYDRVGTYGIAEGKTVTVNDTIIGSGGLCSYSVLRAVTSAGAVSTNKATIKSGNCKDLYWVFFTPNNIIGDVSDCPGIKYLVMGADGGNNENFTFETPPTDGEESVLPDTILHCGNMPYLFKPMPGDPVKCVWKRNGVVISGFSDATYPITDIGEYEVIAYYQSGNTCSLEFSQKVTGVKDEEPPVFIQKPDTVVLGIGGIYTASGPELDATALDCNVNRYWYSLSGATNETIIYNTLQGVTFNEGTTTVTCYANDTVPEGWYTGATPTPNVSAPMTFRVIVIGYPDNVVDVDCSIDPPGQAFSFKQFLVSPTQYTLSNLSIPLVGDIDNDGIVEVIARGGSNAVSTPNLYIFKVKNNQLELMQHLVTPQSNNISNSYAIAKVDANEYAAIFICSQYKWVNTADQLQVIKYTYNPATEQYEEFPVRGVYSHLSNKEVAQPMIVDFNGDGIPEVVAYDKVYNARTMELLVDGNLLGDPTMGFGFGGHPNTIHTTEASSIMAVADIDNDGVPEVIGGNTVYKVNITNPNGTAGNTFTMWKQCDRTDEQGNVHGEAYDGATSVADMDGDGLLDVVVTVTPALNTTSDNGALYIWNPRTGKVMHTNVINNLSAHDPAYVGGPSVTFIGDIDNDKQPEICFTGVYRMYAFEYDPQTKALTLKWSRTTSDMSGATTMVMFDFNQDGKQELVYRDHHHLRIIDGTTGNDLITPISCSSLTANEFPIVADVNNDGAAEIVVMGSERLWIFSSNPAGTWAPARPVWNQFAYNSVNINNDLTVPRHQLNPATRFPGKNGILGDSDDVYPYNGYLMQQTTLSKRGTPLWLAPDVYPEATITSSTVTGNTIDITVGIINQGDAAIGKPVYAALYRESVLLGNFIMSNSANIQILPGDTGYVYFQIPDITLLPPTFNFAIRVNDNGAKFMYQEECDSTNNVLIIQNPILDVYMKKDATLLLSPPVQHNGTLPNPVAVLFSENIKYEITATNITESTAPIQIRDTLPAYLKYNTDSENPSTNFVKSVTASGTPVREILTWTIPNVAAGATTKVSFEATPVDGSCASQPLYINKAWIIIGELQTPTGNSTYHQGAGVGIATFSAGLGGQIFNAEPQAVDYRTAARSGVLVMPDDGYQFDGWSHNEYISLRGDKINACQGIMCYDTLTIFGDVELLAHFSPEVYPVRYFLNGAANADGNPETYTVKSGTLTLEAPEKIGDVFTGWTGANGDKPQQSVTIPQGSTGELEFYANFLHSGRENDHQPDSDEDKIWAAKSELYVRTSKVGSMVKIYSIEGKLIRQQEIKTAGETRIRLLCGIYIVTLNDDIGKKIRID